MRRATVYFDEDLLRALKIRVEESERSLSDIVSDAVRLVLDEDHEDLAAIAERKSEQSISYETFFKGLKNRGQTAGQYSACAHDDSD